MTLKLHKPITFKMRTFDELQEGFWNAVHDTGGKYHKNEEKKEHNDKHTGNNAKLF